MKRIFLFFLMLSVLFVAGNAMAVEWVAADQKTIGWDPVSTLATGETIPAGDAIVYRVYIKRDGQAEGTMIANSVTATQYTLTLDQEGRFFVGIQSVRVYTVDGQDLMSESEIAWSDIPANCNGNDFGIVYLIPPADVGGIGAN